jgi:hypothetical protein
LTVDHEHDDVGFVDREACLLTHLDEEFVDALWLKSASIDDLESPIKPRRLAVLAVARDAGHVFDDREPRPRQAVEKS